MHSKYFIVEELVPKELYNKYGELKCWEFLDPKLLKTIDILKERFPEGSITINNWKWGGDRNWSGIRLPSSSYYSQGSMHSWGKAVDMIFSNYTADEVRLDIIKNPTVYEDIKGLEENISWVHIDTRNREDLIRFTP